jgi:hypothetical protein
MKHERIIFQISQASNTSVKKHRHMQIPAGFALSSVTVGTEGLEHGQPFRA